MINEGGYFLAFIDYTLPRWVLLIQDNGAPPVPPFLSFAAQPTVAISSSRLFDFLSVFWREKSRGRNGEGFVFGLLDLLDA